MPSAWESSPIFQSRPFSLLVGTCRDTEWIQGLQRESPVHSKPLAPPHLAMWAAAIDQLCKFLCICVSCIQSVSLGSTAWYVPQCPEFPRNASGDFYQIKTQQHILVLPVHQICQDVTSSSSQSQVTMKGKHFETVQDAEATTTEQVKRTSELFQTVTRTRDQCVLSQGWV